MATLTHAMLNDLHRGCAHISLLDAGNGEITYSGLDFTGADQIYTVKDSFQVSQEDPSTEELQVDQNDETIDTTVENGEMTMTGNIPSVATALLEYFYTKGSAATGVKGQDGTSYTGEGFFKSPKEVVATVMVESASKKTAVIFARVKFVCAFGQDSSSDPLGLSFTGTVLGNLLDGQGDFAVLRAAS